MSDSIELTVDATFGLQVRLGDYVKQNQQMGTKSDCLDFLYSPVSGTVKEITFDSDVHCFIITIAVMPY